MSRLIKLIWDFRGQVAQKTAEHHLIHLKEFIQIEKISCALSGFEVNNDMHSIAFIVVQENDMYTIRDRLKPNRAEIYNKEKES